MYNQIPSYLKSGQEYMKLWPMQKQLYPLFPECRVISATKLGIKIMPAIAVFVLFMQTQLLGMEFLPQAITFALFFISLPFQGILWLGFRSEQELPPAIHSWYKDIQNKMKSHGVDMRALSMSNTSAKPTFRHLALLLRSAFKELDKAFTKSLF